MPELPEVEHLRRTLEPVLIGRRVIGVNLYRSDIVRSGDGGHGPPRAIDRRGLLLGATIAHLERRGKQMAIIASDGRALGVHLGMTGQVRWLRKHQRPGRTDHVHARWRLDDGSRVLFRDPRRFGRLRPYASADELARDLDSRLGPDALTITSAQLRAAVAASVRAIKACLLDQAVLAGVGNIYADEVLFAARVHPRRRGLDLRPAELAALARAVRAVLRAAVRAGGSTIRDYADGTGAPGLAQRAHRVYGRGGRPCVWCGHELAVAVISQRTTVWCERCQPMG